jgi:hypothetical protein
MITISGMVLLHHLANCDDFIFSASELLLWNPV